MNRFERFGAAGHQFPLRGGGQRDAQAALQLLQPVERKAATVAEKSDHSRGRFVVLRRTDPRGRFGRENLAAGVAAEALQLEDRSLQGSHPRDPQQRGRFVLQVHLPAAALGTPGAVRQRRVRHRHLLRAPVGFHSMAAVPMRLHGRCFLRRRAGRAGLSTGGGMALEHVPEHPARLLRARPEEQPPQPIDRGPLRLQLPGQKAQRIHRCPQLPVLLRIQSPFSGPLEDRLQFLPLDLAAPHLSSIHADLVRCSRKCRVSG